MKVRKEILDFVEEMERVMRKHDPKKGDSWKNCPMSFLFDKLKEEYREIPKINSIDADFGLKIERQDEIIKEVIDVANICMMIWNRLRIRKKEEK